MKCRTTANFARLVATLCTVCLGIAGTVGCQRVAPPAVAGVPAVDASAASSPARISTGATQADEETGAAVPGQPPIKLVVAMAADLRFVEVELEQEFERLNPGIRLEPTFGSSGELFAQMMNQAPYDVFLSADQDYPQKLVAQRVAKADSFFRYAVGHIVLWVRNDSPLQVETAGAEILKDPRLNKFAIANPKTAPYGRAAAAALKQLGLYDELQSKLVLGKNVAQTAQFAESGAADAAVIGLSLASSREFAGKGKYWRFPADTYPRMDQAGVILEHTQHAVAARKFCDFLQSPPATEIFKKYGFGMPEPTPQ